MKERVKYFLVFLTLVTSIYCYPYNFMMKAKIERIGYAKIIKAADQYLETKKATNVINSLSPKPIKINNYGVYIKLDGFFVQEDGIFIPKKDNEKTYSKATDPSYTKLSERLYWYHAAG